MSTIDAIRRFMIGELHISNADSIDAELPLVQNGVLDSIELLQLVEFLEKEIGIEVADTEILPSNLRSLRVIEEFVERKRNTSE